MINEGIDPARWREQLRARGRVQVPDYLQADAAERIVQAYDDYDYPQMRESGYAWPIVDMRMKYVGSIHYGQRVRIRATIVEWENRLRIDYLVTCADTGARLHKASSIQVALSIATREMCWVCPPVLFERLGVKGPQP